MEIIKNILVYLISFLLLVFSSSKASLASYFLILLFILYVEFIKSITVSKVIFGSFISIIILALISLNMDTIDSIVENTELFNRTVNAGQESDDSLAGRGYDRINLYQIPYFLWVAG